MTKTLLHIIQEEVRLMLESDDNTISVGNVSVTYTEGPLDYRQNKEELLSAKTITNLNLLEKYGLQWKRIYVKEERKSGEKSYYIVGEDIDQNTILYSRKEAGEGKQGSTDITGTKTKSVKDVLKNPSLFDEIGISYNKVDVTSNTLYNKEFYLGLIKALNGKKVDKYTMHTDVKHFNNKPPDPYSSNWGIAYSITPKPYYMMGDEKYNIYGSGIIYVYPSSEKIVVNPPDARAIEFRDAAKEFNVKDPESAAKTVLLLMRKVLKKTLKDIDGVDE